MKRHELNKMRVAVAAAIALGTGVVASAGGVETYSANGMDLHSTTAHVALAPTAGNNISGNLELEPVRHGVHVSGYLTGVEPASVHGFHVHEKGDCSAPDGSSAGGHFNPTGVAHGNPAGKAHHAGDIPNITGNSQGLVNVDVVVKDVSLGTGAANDIIGRAIVIHGDADDYTSQPSGNSGPRVACGVIEKGGVSH